MQSSFPGGPIPAKRSNPDGVGVVSSQRQTERDGWLVLHRTEQLR